MMRKTVLTLLCAVLLASQLLAAQERHEYPLVMHAEAPLYPPLARMAKIMGKIVVEFTVKSGEVVTAEAKTGHPLLVKATTENIKTWHFASEVNGTFATTFEYRVQGKETPTMHNPRIEMQLPAFVKITATPTKPSGNDCEPGADIVGKPIKNGAGGSPDVPR
jgi:Gram-negative bacterial TonB protein C-terminal